MSSLWYRLYETPCIHFSSLFRKGGVSDASGLVYRGYDHSDNEVRKSIFHTKTLQQMSSNSTVVADQM